MTSPGLFSSQVSVRFSQADIHDSAASLIDALLSQIETATTAEKVAENDHLARCRLFSVELSQLRLSI